RAADGGERAAADVAHDVTDAPNGKREHQQGEEALGEPIERAAAQRVEHDVSSTLRGAEGGIRPAENGPQLAHLDAHARHIMNAAGPARRRIGPKPAIMAGT